jgi:undecaprenyl-diphosphatase
MRPKEIVATTQAAAFLLAVMGFAALALAYVTNDPLVRLDAEIASGFHDHVTPPATVLLGAITSLGGTAFLAVVTALAAGWLAGRGSRPDAALLVVTFAGSQVVTWVLKSSFRRERPSFGEPLATASSFSFPSGHALASLAVYGAVVYVLIRRSDSARVVAASLAGATLLVAAIGFSRVYLGVHYLSDVLAGYSAGLALLLLTIGSVRGLSPTGRALRSGARPARFRRASRRSGT